MNNQTCLICNGPMKIGHSPNARYCGPRCRNKAFRLKEKGKVPPLRSQSELIHFASKLGDSPQTFEWVGVAEPAAPFGFDIAQHDGNPRMWTIGRS
jgi:hypothetical protein